MSLEISRMVFTECNPSFCPCGDKCTNQRIQRHQWAEGLEKFTTENRGIGIRCAQSIQSGKETLVLQ